jgi:hypothetical protein
VPLLERHELLRSEVEFLIKLAIGQNRRDIAEKLASYHVHNFPVNQFLFSDDDQRLFLIKTRNRLLNK